MNKIKYMLRRILRMDFGRMFRTVRQTAKESGKHSAIIFIDMILCAARYGAGYLDYRTFDFAKMPSRRRKTFVTRGINNEIISKLNDRSAYHKFEDKVLFNKIFAEHIGREWIFLNEASEEEFAEFVRGKSTVMVKPTGELCGIGVEKIAPGEFEPAELYGMLCQKGQLLVEEYIVQHEDVSAIYSGSVNTVRIVTVSDPCGVHVMFIGFRMGSGESVVDNFHFGGMIAVLNEEGVIITDAVNEKIEIFAAHPVSGVMLKGLKIPFVKEAVEKVKQAARLVPEIRYVGWDVAITEDGPIFVEANHNPAYDFYQTRAYMSENEYGLLPLFESVVKEI